MVIQGLSILSGQCQGPVVWTDTPLSFWGGVDPETGIIVDRHHPLCGTCITNRVLVVPATRGSSTSSGVFLEMIRAKTAPVGIVTLQLDPVLALGAIIGEKLYQRSVVMLTVSSEGFDQLKGCADAAVLADARIISDQNIEEAHSS